MKKSIVASLVVLASVITGFAYISVFNGYLVNDPALAYSKNYDMNLVANGIGSMSAQATYSTATIAAKTFSDGSISEGNLTVASLPELSSASAINQLTVVSTSIARNASLALPGHVLRNGIDFRASTVTTRTAIAIAAALNKIPDIRASAIGNMVYSTATVYGTYYNTWKFRSNTAGITISNTYFIGGQDLPIVTVNGVPLMAKKDWNVGLDSATTAVSLASAINSNSRLSPWVKATANSPTDGIIALESKNVGLMANYSLKSSVPSAITISSAHMMGATNASFTINNANINIPSHGFSLALPVLYTQDTIAIAPLVDQTTYYVGVVDADNIKLAVSAEDAVGGSFINLTSSSTLTVAGAYTLTPLDISGTLGLVWKASNDAVTWTDMAVSSISAPLSGSMVPASYTWNFGAIASKYVRLAVTGPDTGGVNLKVVLSSKH